MCSSWVYRKRANELHFIQKRNTRMKVKRPKRIYYNIELYWIYAGKDKFYVSLPNLLMDI
jgi:hypothetical protein